MGPLTGFRIVELAGIGPGPFAAMLLADMGAEVLRIDRPEEVSPGCRTVPPDHLIYRGRRSVAIDLKQSEGADLLMSVVETADALIEGFRPGVAERLKIDPDRCHQRNPRLIYGRVTGWGQDGPWATEPGHDLNYIAMTGIAAAVGPAKGPPVPPLNLVGDFGGGGMLLAFGVLAGLLECQRSGRGQVVDAAMLDGAALLATCFYGWHDQGGWSLEREANLLDGGAPFYRLYETSDRRFVAVGAIEPKFYAALLEGLELDPEELPEQYDRTRWPLMRELLEARFRRRSRNEWAEAMTGLGACVTPVLDFDEARRHPVNLARQVFAEHESGSQPSPAPRLSRTPGAIDRGPALAGEHTTEALAEWGIPGDRIKRLLGSGVLREWSKH